MGPEAHATLRQTLNPRARGFWRDLALPWAIGAAPLLALTLLGTVRLWDAAMPWDSAVRTFGLLWMTVSGPFAGVPERIVFGASNFLHPSDILIGTAFSLTPLWIVLIAGALGQRVKRRGMRITVGVASLLWHAVGLMAWGVGV